MTGMPNSNCTPGVEALASGDEHIDRVGRCSLVAFAPWIRVIPAETTAGQITLLFVLENRQNPALQPRKK